MPGTRKGRQNTARHTTSHTTARPGTLMSAGVPGYIAQGVSMRRDASDSLPGAEGL